MNEILIIDDGSTDGTREILKNIDGDGCIHVIYNEHNQGKGAAVVTGINNARSEILLIQNADPEYHPRNSSYLARGCVIYR